MLDTQRLITKAWRAGLVIALPEASRIVALPTPIRLPLFGHSVPAGFPSPADDFIESVISLDAVLVQHPAATFFVRVKGCSMQQDGIQDGDVVVVDRSLEPRNGDVVIAILDGELTIKRLRIADGKVQLVPANARFPVIEINIEQELSIWGIVTSSIHRHRAA